MTNLEIIRAACIKANPEILIEEIEHDQGDQEPAIEVVTRSIRLADVLWAIYEAYLNGLLNGKTHQGLNLAGGIYADMSGEFLAGGVMDGASLEIKWNLRKDSLKDQSEEIIAFLASLLT